MKSILIGSDLVLETVSAGFIFAILHFGERLVRVSGGDPLLFDGTKFEFSFKWLFDAGQLSVIVMFIVASFLRVFKRISGRLDD
jgi:hypothetical protein